MVQRKGKGRIYLQTLTQPIISKERAERENLLVFSLSQYSERFFVSRSTAYYRVRTRKVRAFKHSGDWWIVIPQDSTTGF